MRINAYFVWLFNVAAAVTLGYCRVAGAPAATIERISPLKVVFAPPEVVVVKEVGKDQVAFLTENFTALPNNILINAKLRTSNSVSWMALLPNNSPQYIFIETNVVLEELKSLRSISGLLGRLGKAHIPNVGPVGRNLVEKTWRIAYLSKEAGYVAVEIRAGVLLEQDELGYLVIRQGRFNRVDLNAPP